MQRLLSLGALAVATSMIAVPSAMAADESFGALLLHAAVVMNDDNDDTPGVPSTGAEGLPAAVVMNGDDDDDNDSDNDDTPGVPSTGAEGPGGTPSAASMALGAMVLVGTAGYVARRQSSKA